MVLPLRRNARRIHHGAEELACWAGYGAARLSKRFSPKNRRRERQMTAAMIAANTTVPVAGSGTLVKSKCRRGKSYPDGPKVKSAVTIPCPSKEKKDPT